MRLVTWLWTEVGLTASRVLSNRDLGRLPDLLPGGRPWEAVCSADGGFLIAGSVDDEVGVAEIATRSIVARIALSRKGNRTLAHWPVRKGDELEMERESSRDMPMLEALAVSHDGRAAAFGPNAGAHRPR